MGGGVEGSIGATASWVVGIIACLAIVGGILNSPAGQRKRFGFPLRPDLGRIFPLRARLRHRARRGRRRQQLSLAARHRRPLCRGQRNHRPGRRPLHPAWHRHSGADRHRRRHRHDLHHHAHPLRPLCLRDRRQSGSGRTRRHQDALGDGTHLHAHGCAVGIASAISTARLNAATNAQGTLDELYVIAAAVIGGTSLGGGVGTIVGAMIGAVVMQSLQSGHGADGHRYAAAAHRGRLSSWSSPSGSTRSTAPVRQVRSRTHDGHTYARSWR
jgi:D-xylose transport system permease protein